MQPSYSKTHSLVEEWQKPVPGGLQSIVCIGYMTLKIVRIALLLTVPEYIFWQSMKNTFKISMFLGRVSPCLVGEMGKFTTISQVIWDNFNILYQVPEVTQWGSWCWGFESTLWRYELILFSSSKQGSWAEWRWVKRAAEGQHRDVELPAPRSSCKALLLLPGGGPGTSRVPGLHRPDPSASPTADRQEHGEAGFFLLTTPSLAQLIQSIFCSVKWGTALAISEGRRAS